LLVSLLLPLQHAHNSTPGSQYHGWVWNMLAVCCVCAFEQVPGEEPGSSNRWSVMVHYDTTTGQLLTHYHTWEAGIHPQPQQLQQVFSPGAHTQLMQEQHNRHTSIR
jgi:hypothetical protein